MLTDETGMAMAQLSAAAELARYGPHARYAPRLSYAESLAYCRRLARTHYENFTVASWLLPRRLLPHFYAIYAYCRWADDLADETPSQEESLQLLDWWQDQLELCFAGKPEHPVFVALLPTIREFSIPIEPFAHLLVAFRQDQHVTRYATHEDVLRYCQCSANPVGRLVLHVGRSHDHECGPLSDQVCTGLQLANFCQDVKRDFAAGRIYLPRTTLEQFGYTEAMFARGECNDAFRQVLRLEVERAEHYLRSAQRLVDLVAREIKLDVALFIAGGLRILAAIRELDFDMWSRRPTVSKWDQGRLLLGSWWRARRAGR